MIQDTIKEYMEAHHLTYEEVARTIGTTKQNLWKKLNRRKAPEFGGVKEVLGALGFQMKVEKVEEGASLDFEQLLSSEAMEGISYEAMEDLVRSLGYEIVVTPPEEAPGQLMVRVCVFKNTQNSE